MSSETWPWLALALLGASHGINPGMGWLFAAALGLQERRARAVWRALGPLALGHALAVGVVLTVAVLLGAVVPVRIVKPLVAVLLVSYGVFRIIRNAHPAFGGMRMSMRDLTVWSFLMASAHGAGLMVVPVVLERDAPPAAIEVHDHHRPADAVPHAQHAGIAGASRLSATTATAIHTAAYLLVTGLIALAVYRWFGVHWIRRAWVNLDLVWGMVLVVTGILTWGAG